MSKKTEETPTPFFSRFLERQDREEEKTVRVRTDVKSGCNPSDPHKPGVFYTCKYPSDGDDGGPVI